MGTIIQYGIILVLIGIASFLVYKYTKPCEEDNIIKNKKVSTANIEIATEGMLYNPQIGAQKKIHSGFSWTVLFLGFFVPLFREDYKWALIMFLLGIVTCGLSNIFFAIKYNEIQTKDLKEKGYRESE